VRVPLQAVPKEPLATEGVDELASGCRAPETCSCCRCERPEGANLPSKKTVPVFQIPASPLLYSFRPAVDSPTSRSLRSRDAQQLVFASARRSR